MTEATFYLKIIAADKVFFSGRCKSLILPQHDGQKQILAHHENMVIAVNEGEAKFKREDSDAWEYAAVGVGFAEVMNNRVTLLVEFAERPEEIDVVRARNAEERAQEQLRQERSMREYHHSQASLARAMARLRVARERKV